MAPPPMFCDARESWLCPSCWLLADASGNPFRALDVDGPWFFQSTAFAEQCPPDPDKLVAANAGLEAWGVEDGVPGGAVVVLWDSGDRSCTVVVNALLHAFGPKLLRLVDFRDRAALDAVLARHPGLPWAPLCRQGGVSAVLQTGIFISGCETHPKVLLYELKYRRNVLPACPDHALRFRRVYEEPLHGLRESFVLASSSKASSAPGGESAAAWWSQPAAMDAVTRALVREKYAIIDGFLPSEDYDRLHHAARALAQRGQLQRGNRGGGRRLEEDGADLLNTCNRPRKWTMWDDNVAYCGDADARAPPVGAVLTQALDEFVSQLKAGGSGVQPVVAERLREVFFREKVMIACYRAETRGQYFQHIDSAGGAQRWLTTILYLNPDWSYEDGGFNRMYHEGWFNTSVKADILPVANRLLVFWAEDDCPHEVTACPTRDRYAMTVWFAHGPTLLRERLATHEGRKELVEDFHPMRPYSLTDAAVQAMPELAGDPRLASCADAYERRQAEARAAAAGTWPSGLGGE